MSVCLITADEAHTHDAPHHETHHDEAIGCWQDALAPAADLVASVLGQASPVAHELQRLADTNASASARQRRAGARQLRDVRLPPWHCVFILLYLFVFVCLSVRGCVLLWCLCCGMSQEQSL